MARRIIAETAEKSAEIFETSSKDLIIGLLSLGHKPCVVEAEGRIIYYKFPKQKVASDVTKMLTGDDIDISYHKSIAANALWAINLTRANELNSA